MCDGFQWEAESRVLRLLIRRSLIRAQVGSQNTLYGAQKMGFGFAFLGLLYLISTPQGNLPTSISRSFMLCTVSTTDTLLERPFAT
jgi:hypothetical protein